MPSKQVIVLFQSDFGPTKLIPEKELSAILKIFPNIQVRLVFVWFTIKFSFIYHEF